jgi:demethylmenaquinone methyltransferase / 2-methoxy-6-polyprenyl-1,4-benzoquinol methylase
MTWLSWRQRIWESDEPVRDHRIRPHPVLTGYYPSLHAHAEFLRGLFNRTAASYDRINRVMSLGCGGWYRRNALRQAGLRRGARVLDVAVGTGLVAREIVRICGQRGSVVGLDPSEKMLAIARHSLGIAIVQGRAEKLPIADACMDFVSMGYALRHMSCLSDAFAEFRRVLRPGGTLLILDFGRPQRAVCRFLARAYFASLVPALCRMLGDDEEVSRLMRYCWDTVEFCVAPDVVLETLANTGFTAGYCTSSLGVFRAYTASKPTGGGDAQSPP